jgi:hypothetical protein
LGGSQPWDLAKRCNKELHFVEKYTEFKIEVQMGAVTQVTARHMPAGRLQEVVGNNNRRWMIIARKRTESGLQTDSSTFSSEKVD